MHTIYVEHISSKKKEKILVLKIARMMLAHIFAYEYLEASIAPIKKKQSIKMSLIAYISNLNVFLNLLKGCRGNL